MLTSSSFIDLRECLYEWHLLSEPSPTSTVFSDTRASNEQVHAVRASEAVCHHGDMTHPASLAQVCSESSILQNYLVTAHRHERIAYGMRRFDEVNGQLSNAMA